MLKSIVLIFLLCSCVFWITIQSNASLNAVTIQLDRNTTSVSLFLLGLWLSAIALWVKRPECKKHL